MTVRVPSWRYLPVAFALVLPVVVCAVETWFYAKKQQRMEAEAAAQIVRVQVENILAQAWPVLDQVADLTPQPCADVLPQLRRWGTLNPYFRSLVLSNERHIYCSSAVGEVDFALGDLRQWPIEGTPDRWLFSVAGTPLAPDRPAILLGKPGAPGYSGAVAVDGRYVLDLLNAVATLGDYRLELIVGKGAPIRSDSWGASDAGVEPVYDEITRNNGRVALTIHVKAPTASLIDAWRQLLLGYLPAALLIGAGLAFAAYRLQLNRLSFKEQLRRAMLADEFQVHYQPVYGQLTGQCEGVEALMRWNRPGVGFVRPDIFIAAAEAEGMIIPLTQHLLRLIERDMQSWVTPPDFHVGVNIAPEHLSSAALVPDIQAFVGKVAARRPLIVLEITERSLISDSGQARSNIDTLRAAGVRVAIDDFGTGHCSLSYLQKFPVDYLKIDKGFVQAIMPSGEEAPVLDVIITLSHRLNLAVVAEGVETQEQFDYLTTRGVAFIQGYLFARPMPSADFVPWYARHSPPGAQAA
ncbi:EAL domain-containing protein [Achromobacter spanius]|uniref:cyclic-guanylate-specific phosphodiesterase n=1 Tax=Achromobacter spanius TaxID=217203 RepID=A0ABY8GME7_9BURK|nr:MULTISPECIES: EAL domain-containing protein [Achromobacter]WAI84964.1 EAL domain-containing protein [Achromobacter spanius]WEX95046.1 EAL domain-containing protein [Achromobacter sp. SS2-2022]WFP05783.1 EAL domain-containing protein [Achromobacter spanius]